MNSNSGLFCTMLLNVCRSYYAAEHKEILNAKEILTLCGMTVTTQVGINETQVLDFGRGRAESPKALSPGQRPGL